MSAEEAFGSRREDNRVMCPERLATGAVGYYTSTDIIQEASGNDGVAFWRARMEAYHDRNKCYHQFGAKRL